LFSECAKVVEFEEGEVREVGRGGVGWECTFIKRCWKTIGLDILLFGVYGLCTILMLVMFIMTRTNQIIQSDCGRILIILRDLVGSRIDDGWVKSFCSPFALIQASNIRSIFDNGGQARSDSGSRASKEYTRVLN
jgi:hypothetical protein